MLLYKSSEGQCKDHSCVCEIQGIKSCKKTLLSDRVIFHLLNYCHWLDTTKGLWQPVVCLLTEAEASMWIRLTECLDFFYWAFVPEGMNCNYLRSPYLFTFNWKAKILLKLSLSNWSFLFVLFLDVCMTSRWTNDTVWSGSKFKPSHT